MRKGKRLQLEKFIAVFREWENVVLSFVFKFYFFGPRNGYLETIFLNHL